MRPAVRATLLIGLACMTGPLAGAQSPVEVRPYTTPAMDSAKLERLIETGHSALKDADFKTAYDALRRAQIERRDDGGIALALGDALLGLGKPGAAAAQYRAAPNTAESFAGITLCHAALGTSDDIELDLNAALEINLKDTRLWTALGQYYDRAGRSLEARATYVHALKYGADHGVIVNNLGMSLLREGRYALALEKFNQANAIAPDNNLFDANRRLTLAVQGDYAGAVSDLQEDRAAQIYNDAGFIAAGAGRVDIARALYNRALKISPVWFEPAHENLKNLDARL